MSRYWWVNHNQTFQQEISGGFLWSPKSEANGARSQFYDNMRLAIPNDLVLSFAETRVSFVGRVADWGFSAPRPKDFDAAGPSWSAEGWLLPVTWSQLPSPVRPKDILAALAPRLPAKYSPISASTGNGNQKAYLAEISREVFDLILQQAGLANPPEEVGASAKRFESFVEDLDESVESQIVADRSLGDTERLQLLQARRGQGLFRERLRRIECQCRVTGVSSPALLIASHIKPWRSCKSGAERLDGNNGLLLTPHVDLLFDHGLISFGDDGMILVSPRLNPADLDLLGLGVRIRMNAGAFSQEQRKYLSFHRANCFMD